MQGAFTAQSAETQNNWQPGEKYALITVGQPATAATEPQNTRRLRGSASRTFRPGAAMKPSTGFHGGRY